MWRLACMTRIPCSYCIVVYGVHRTERCIARGGTAPCGQAAGSRQVGSGAGWAGWLAVLLQPSPRPLVTRALPQQHSELHHQHHQHHHQHPAVTAAYTDTSR